MPVNSFVCQRRSCQTEFTADFDPTSGSPFCPSCGGKPCKWLPKACNTNHVAKQLDKRMQSLVDEHNQRVMSGDSPNPAMRIADLRCERGQPAIRTGPEPVVKQLVIGPDGKPRDVPAPGYQTPDVKMNVLAAAGLLTPQSRAIPVNRDGRPPTDMAVLGGVCPRPPMAPPMIVNKGR